MEDESFVSYAKVEIGAFITMIMMGIMLLSNNILATIPFVIVASFTMYWIGVSAWTIYIGAIMMHIILGIAVDKVHLGLFMLPLIFLEISGGILLSRYLKKFIHDGKQSKYIIFSILSLVLVFIGVQSHWEMFGEPVKYLRAKEGIQTYINDTYKGKLKIQSIRHSWKMDEYIANVQSTEDSRDAGTIYYGRTGYIGDDYHFRIEEKQGLQAEQTLLGIIKQKTDIPISDIRLYTSIELPHNKYTSRDMYLGEEPIAVRITLEPGRVEDQDAYKEKYGKLPEHRSYEDMEAFSKEAYKIVEVLKEINYPYKEIKIESFLPDGNRTYNITIDGEIKVDDFNNLLDIAHVEESGK